jgi:hypothetical protein
MFEVGKVYEIKIWENGDATTCMHCKVLEIEMPLIKITGMASGPDYDRKPTILNTSSPAFISAEPKSI